MGVPSVHIDKDLVAASATPLVLGILAEGESYGYAILKRVNDLSEARMNWTDGMLYPLLHRLERLGYVQATWHVSSSGRRRKHYAITDAGRETLAARQQQWEVVTAALSQVWRTAVTAPPIVTAPGPVTVNGPARAAGGLGW